MNEKIPFRKMKHLIQFARDEMEMEWSILKIETEGMTDGTIEDDTINKLLHYLILKGVLDD